MVLLHSAATVCHIGNVQGHAGPTIQKYIGRSRGILLLFRWIAILFWFSLLGFLTSSFLRLNIGAVFPMKNVILGSMRWFTMACGVPGLQPHVDLGRISMQLDDMKALLWAKISEMG